MRVLGVDPGTRFLGYGVIEVDGPTTRCLDWGTLEGAPSKAIGERLYRIQQGLGAVIERWRPDQMAIEEPFVAPQRGAKSGIVVGQAQAIALVLAAGAGMPVHRYAPSRVKSAVADYGAGTKKQVAQAVRLLLGLDEAPASEDASDALAVALCHIQQWRADERVRTARVS